MENNLAPDARHQSFLRWFQEFEDSTNSARTAARRDRDYYDGKQWTEAEITELNRRRQPVITINRIKRKVDSLTGVEIQNRTDPKAFPRNPTDQGAAQAATDAIRFVCQNNNFDVVRSDVWENMVVEGVGGCIVGAEKKRGEVEITIDQVPWDRLFWDPHSRMRDFADAKYLGVAIWMDLEDALAKWPGKEEVLEVTLLGAVVDTASLDDRPAKGSFGDDKRKRVRVLEIYFQEKGTWKTCQFTGSGLLTQVGESAWLDEDGVPGCPLVLTSAHVDRDNNRYGAVREMISPQDEINKRRSKALHLLNMRQVVTEKGATEGMGGIRRAQSELAKPDGVLEITPGMRFDLLPTADLALGNLNLLQEAKSEIDAMGPNASLQGKQDQQLSGRALLAQQQAGMSELGRISDARRQWDLRVYGQVWARIRQFWKAEKWIRVTDDENTPRFVGLNRPAAMREKMLPAFEGLAEEVAGLPEDMRPEFMGMLQELAATPEFSQAVDIENPIADLDIDLILEQAPDSVTIQGEQFDQLVKLPQAGVPVPPEVIIEASSLRNKKKLLALLSGAGDPAAQALAQAEATTAQLEAAMAEAEIAKIEAQTAERQARARQIMAETNLDLAEAGIDLAAAGVGAPRPAL